jgi:glycosyltransferase involved in cell wall biosynthesis
VRPAGRRRGIVSLPPPIAGNPYQRLLYEELARHGIVLEPVERFRATWLWTARGRAGRLHFHWPQVYYHDDRLGGAASWLRLGLFAGRLGAARALGYRIAWTVHQVYPHESPSRRLDRAAGRLLARASDVLIAHDPATAEAVSRELGSRGVHVLAHPPYTDAYPPGRPRGEVRAALGLRDETFVFLCFGHLRAYKELDRLVAAFAAADVGDAALVVAGEPVDSAAASVVERAAAADARIVPLLARVPDGGVAELHSASDAAVIARADGGTSGALALALTLGLPAVAADAYADRVGAAGWVFPADAADGLRSALERAASDPRLPEIRAAAADAAGPGWDEMGARTAALFGGAG